MIEPPEQANDLSQRLDRLATHISQLTVEHAHLSALGEEGGPASHPAIVRRVAEMGRLIREVMIITLRLPLTVSLFEALIARVGGEKYLFRLDEVAEVVRPGQASLANEGGREFLVVRGVRVPVLHLADWLGRVDNARAGKPVGAALVARRQDGVQLALLVDEVVETQQILSRPLGRDLRDLPGFSGGAILADGAAALVLDIKQILETAA